MLQAKRVDEIKQWLSALSHEELIWLSGYSAGLIQTNALVENNTTAIPTEQAVKRITIVYGTETGNAKRLSSQLAAKAKQKAIISKTIGLDQYRLADIAKETHLVVIISTHGDGEPPIAAKNFYDYIHDSPLDLKQLHYSVLALGDSSYPMFCKTGEDVDHQLALHGAKNIIPIQKCDVDYEEAANQWFDKLLTTLQQPAEIQSKLEPIVAPIAKKATGKKTYTGTVATNINLNAQGSNRATHHIELSVSDIEYLPGDSIGVVPHNPSNTVKTILALTGIDAQKQINFKKETGTVEQLLSEKINVHYLLENTIKKYAAILQRSEIPVARVDLVELLKTYPVNSAEQFEEVLAMLNPIPPRLYTIASSPTAHGNQEVHITVLKEQFTANNILKEGLCSSYLAAIEQDQSLSFFVQPNKRFRLPEPDKDIIMIGQGTGIAPFRSFVAERDATGATGKNWLFFGEQQFTTDFLYQTEWQNWLATGVLTQISTAFSNDLPRGTYIEHKLLQASQEIFNWIKAGAHIYICGNKEKMGVQVEKAILHIIATQAHLAEDEAKAYLHKLEEENRYEKDLY